MKRASELVQVDLAYIVDYIHRLFYLREDGTWDRDKEVPGADLVDEIGILFTNAGMVPEEEEPDLATYKYRAIGTCEDGPFDITVNGISPADAFVEAALSVKGEATIDSLTDESGRDVIDDIDPEDPIL